jgi:hypothetical protein
LEAVKWYQKAAFAGNHFAQSNLGNYYAKGEGVPKDIIEAYAYLNLAGTVLAEARENLAILEKGMSQDVRLKGQQRTKELQRIIEDDKFLDGIIESRRQPSK